MERRPKTLAAASELLEVSTLLQTSVQTVIKEWASEPIPTPHLPSPALHQAQRTILAIAGKLTELVSEPNERILEVACQYWESRALSILAERRVPDLIAASTDPEAGVPVEQLASQTRIEASKLSRLLRACCSLHIFREPAPDVFANNVSSAALVNNEPLRAYVMNFALDLYTASEWLPRHLLGDKGHSFKVDETAWQEAHATTKTRWDWLEEKVPRKVSAASGVEAQTEAKGVSSGEGGGYPGYPDREFVAGGKGSGEDDLVERPEHKVFSLAMLGGGMVYGAAHPYDYPWGELGEATVVDVGGGLGGFDIQLSRLYPQLNFVLQDRGPGLKHAEQVIWPKEAPQALEKGRITFMEHDFFEPNPVKDADVYWLRYVIHDWSDDYCVKILSAIRGSMSSTKSRVLICDQVMNTTLGCDELEPAPKPLPANYGYYTRYSHQRDLCMMGIINGIERTPREFKVMVERAGFRIEKIWECRSQVSIVELRIQETSNGANGSHEANGLNGHVDADGIDGTNGAVAS